MRKIVNLATGSYNSRISLKAEPGSTWFWYSGVFLFGLWLAVSFMLPFGPVQAKPADTTPPTVPGTPSAGGAYTKVCSLNWTWGASTDSGSGLAGYQYILYRNSSFITSGNTASTSYSNGCFGSGTYALYVRAYDNVGNYSAYASGSIIIDTAAPTCSVSASGSTLTATCSDTGGSGCTQATKTQTATATGTYTFTFNDNAGNSGSCSYAYTAPPSDTTPPTFTVSPTATVTGPTSGSVTYSDPSGVAQVAYCILTGSGVLGTCNPSQFQASATINFSMYTPTTVVCHNGSDTLSNWGTVSCSTFYALPPSVLNGDFYTPGGYTNGTVSLQWVYFSSLASSFDVYRNGSYIGSQSANYPPVNSYSYTDNSCPVAGNYTYQIMSGNSSGLATFGPTQTVYKYSCDVTPPTGSVLINSGNLLTGSQTVDLDITCIDSGSGCNTYAVYTSSDCTGSPVNSGAMPYNKFLSVTLPISGYTMYASVNLKDAVGNAACVSDSIYYDVTPPTGTISINGGASLTQSTSVNLSLSCSDNSSSFGGGPVAFKTTNRWLSWLDPLIDWLGFNKVAQALPAGPNTLGCEMMQFSNDGVNYSVQENYATTKAWTLSSCSNNQTVYVKYLDSVGNAAVSSSSISCDNIAPTCSVSASGSTLTATCSDTGGSGCTQATKTQTATATGTYTFTFNDNAGNSGSCSYYYTALPPPTACASVGVTSVVSGSGATNVTPVTFQCYGSSGGAVSEYVHIYYLNDFYQGTAVNQPSYLSLALGQGAYVDCIQAHNSAGYSTTTCGSMSVDTVAPYPSSVSAGTQGTLPNRIYTNNVNSNTTQIASSITSGSAVATTNANDPQFSVTISDNGSGIASSGAYCQVSRPGVNIVGSCGCTGGVCSVSQIQAGQNNAIYSFKIYNMKDNAGNLFSSSNTINFEVNNLPPTILKVQ